MTLEQLRIFLAVAERQHVTRASEALNLTQSAVSSAISALEARHDVKLFDRIGRRIVLTNAGRSFMSEAAAVLHRAEAAELALSDFSKHPSGHLRIYASQTVASYWLPSRLVALRARHPGIIPTLQVGNTAQVGDAVLEGAADLGLIEGDVTHQALRKQVIARDNLILLMGADHPWAARREIPLSDYAKQSWILRETGSGTRSAFEAVLSAAGQDPAKLSVTLELPSNEAVLAAVTAGDCLSVLSHRAVDYARAAGRIVTRDIPGGGRDFAALTHPDRHRTRAVSALLAVINS
ncbi:LysR family transcriptional regulator [Pararhodobacter oceanensis]|uniref:LysR family transcriptional regulator n=1 Tax=Pararhodobacter oceanensis TaxID=2172121 RepID=UPI003A921D37